MGINVAAIVAMSQNRIIGKDNRLPWHLPQDLQHFKSLTMGKPVVMGRLTFDSIGKALPGRHVIVVTSQPDWCRPGVQVARDVDAALGLGREVAKREAVSEVIVAGGATIYHQTLARLNRIYITQIHQDVEGDSLFPALEAEQWREVQRSERFSQGDSGIEYSFLLLQRRVTDSLPQEGPAKP